LLIILILFIINHKYHTSRKSFWTYCIRNYDPKNLADEYLSSINILTFLPFIKELLYLWTLEKTDRNSSCEILNPSLFVSFVKARKIVVNIITENNRLIIRLLISRYCFICKVMNVVNTYIRIFLIEIINRTEPNPSWAEVMYIPRKYVII